MTRKDKETKIEVLKRKISQYFAHMNVVEADEDIEIIYAESKMNKDDILDEELVSIKIETQEELDAKIAEHKSKKKNYFGNRHLVEPKKSKKKEDKPVVSKLPQNEVMEILRKNRSHPLWGKEIYRWSMKDWESLFKLRDEK